MANIEISGLPGFTALATLNEKTEPYLTTARSNSSIGIIPHREISGVSWPVDTDGNPDVDGANCTRGCGDNCRSCIQGCYMVYKKCIARAQGNKNDIGDCKSDGNSCFYTCCGGVPP